MAKVHARVHHAHPYHHQQAQQAHQQQQQHHQPPPQRGMNSQQQEQQPTAVPSHKVVKPIAVRQRPTGNEYHVPPDYSTYRRITSNSAYRSRGFRLHVNTSHLNHHQHNQENGSAYVSTTCPFMNRQVQVLAQKSRKTTERPVFALSVHLLKTYKSINTIYYAEKRKRDALQKQVVPKQQPQPQQPPQQQQLIMNQQQQKVKNAFPQQSQQQQQQQYFFPAAIPNQQFFTQPILYPSMFPATQLITPQSFNMQPMFPHTYNQMYATTQLAPPIPQHQPSLYNDGYDDENGNYIVQINEELASRYIVQESLGKGSFGVVVKAYDTYKGELVAVKVIKNKAQFYEQAKVEIAILTDLQQKDRSQEFNVVQMKHYFEWRNHLCIVFELLSYNLYDLLKYTNFKGVSLKLIRKFAQQLLYTLYFLSRSDVNIIHCDLKPENILLKHYRKSLIKVIDFGSSCYIHKKMFKYIQSRFYRSPEVLLGLPYSTTIDMWSFGCILVEMHTGLPLFDGKNERDQLWKIVQVLGMPPRWMIEKSPKKDMFFKYNSATQSYVLNNPNYVPNSRSLLDIIGVNTHGPEGRRMNQEGHSRLDYLQFYDLVVRVLQFDPSMRILPVDALKHDFFQAGNSNGTPSHQNVNNSDGPRMSTSPDSPIGSYYQHQQATMPQLQQQQQQQLQQQQQPAQMSMYYQAPPPTTAQPFQQFQQSHQQPILVDYSQYNYNQIPQSYYYNTTTTTNGTRIG